MVCSLCCERDGSFAARAAQEDLPQQLFSCSPPPIPVPACCASGLSFQLRVLGPAPRYRSELLPPGVPSACGCCGNPCRLLPPPDLPNGLACPPLLIACSALYARCVRPCFTFVMRASGSCGFTHSPFDPLPTRFRSNFANCSRVGVAIPDSFPTVYGAEC